MALIQELWCCEGHILGLNIPVYTLFSASATDGHRACILALNRNTWMLPGFSCTDLAAVLINYNEGDAVKHLVVCSYLPYDSVDSPPVTEYEELVCYFEEENLCINIGCDFNSHHTVWGSTN
jgi:hypothetical protein